MRKKEVSVYTEGVMLLSYQTILNSLKNLVRLQNDWMYMKDFECSEVQYKYPTVLISSLLLQNNKLLMHFECFAFLVSDIAHICNKLCFIRQFFADMYSRKKHIHIKMACLLRVSPTHFICHHIYSPLSHELRKAFVWSPFRHFTELHLFDFNSQIVIPLGNSLGC